MKRGERILAGMGVFLQILWGIINLPLALFFGLISLLRTLIGLAVLCGLGALAYEVYTHYQTRENTTQSRNAGGGEVRRDGARARQEALDRRAGPRGGGRRPEAVMQSTEDRRREAAAAKRARARYQVEQRRLLEERVLGQKRERGNI